LNIKEEEDDPGVVVYADNPSIQEVEDLGCLHSEALPQKHKKIKTKKRSRRKTIKASEKELVVRK
jgi:hypothetical protein